MFDFEGETLRNIRKLRKLVAELEAQQPKRRNPFADFEEGYQALARAISETLAPPLIDAAQQITEMFNSPAWRDIFEAMEEARENRVKRWLRRVRRWAGGR